MKAKMTDIVLVIDPATDVTGWAIGTWDDDRGCVDYFGSGRVPRRGEKALPVRAGTDKGTTMAAALYDVLEDAYHNGGARILVWEKTFSPNRDGMATLNQLIGGIKQYAADMGFVFGKPLNPQTVDRLCFVPYPRGLKAGKKSEARKRGLRMIATQLENEDYGAETANMDAMSEEEFDLYAVAEHEADAKVMVAAYFERIREAQRKED